MPFHSKGTLRTEGMYRYSRNPQNIADIDIVSGWMILSAAPWAMVVGLAGIAVLIAAPFSEEPWLKDQYGTRIRKLLGARAAVPLSYRQYRQSRLLPHQRTSAILGSPDIFAALCWNVVSRSFGQLDNLAAQIRFGISSLFFPSNSLISEPNFPVNELREIAPKPLLSQ